VLLSPSTTTREGRRARLVQDKLLRPVTRRLPPPALRLLCAGLGRLTFVRDRYAREWQVTGSTVAGRLAGALGTVAVGRHRDHDIAALLNFDWYSPRYRSYHTEDELRAWFTEAGFGPPTLLPQRLSAHARRAL
jgi:hypothetical protein